ncbi:MAG TPA: magnesium transporter CorA family protein [Acidimicrobiia bacterium]|nr:magnesium transporter CorA family protein [Acidimicrobiia bacterium]
MIRAFAWTPDSGDLPSASWEGQIPEIPDGGWVWIDMSDASSAEISETCASFDIPQPFIDEALAEASLPIFEERRDLIYVVLNAFRSTNEGRLAPSEVDFFIGPNFVISVHAGDVASTAMVQERLAEGIGIAIPSPGGLLAQLAMVGSRRLPGLIDQLESQLDSLEELAMRADPRALNEAYALRRDVIIMRRILVPQRQIYEDLAEQGGHPLIDPGSRLEFERVSDYQGQVLESLESARSLLGSVVETYRGAVADRTNDIVRVLTVFSAILLPLTLISGIYGMNFIEIPLAEHPWGFWVTVGGMAIVAAVLWFYFGRRRFVGTPRLGDLPKAVGLGIYQVGTAPIRAVAGGIESTIRLVAGEDDTDDETSNTPD